ncbi:M1 family metallopeptidase [Flavobacteriaceae bacterium]|uniref:M1 family metallopeptidase n=1 Tax=Candidatus Arcticimaribacter forsetii TaxID=2820661 RepID=UPI002076F83C|nr:M1 family metallopeptidase [Candidatus Arcticimaribacter forsetii]MDA8698614.1 M1 family metallopeptidase [Flavobacteriaceae bacterium]MDB2329629.1 M1 family metallopeptidase [Flavobacteriaceae bacterium]MDB4621102.1 M1 family metallopeptidase [Flavobacteriaceae bacterium]MDB4673913.1 M1 family metallopeptidase [Flavobacteriaceae bacterium]MDB4714506.1 M1 family metallopeptidase [Flavobacteriaceae bacterium]
MKYFAIALLSLFSLNLSAQYWQQKVDYTMNVELDAETADYSGSQKLIYTNNSPESLSKVFYHLYFNAFQPGSDMAIRLKNGGDRNGRFKVDLDSLNEFQSGYLKVSSLKQNGKPVQIKESGTILEVTLNEPILSGGSTVLELDFKGHVPDLIRRAGKNSTEGVAYSMAQWYPKMSEYDVDGWNTDPYTGREFHGVWGDFDVKITLDKEYTVGGSGYLQNADKIGKGYSDRKKSKSKKGKITWHFIAPNVHDFTFAADKDYVHDIYPGPNNVDLHFFYKNNPEIIENWKKLQPLTAELMEYFNEKIGPYPYKQYSVIHGGDGGMEYAMCTLITGERKFGSLVGVTSHELAHSWFQHILATNETKHEWMDEGFTSYISTLAKNKVLKEESEFPLLRSYGGYLRLATSGVEEPQSANANRYHYNFAYESTAYNKGAVFLGQLGYIIGMDKLNETLKTYYNEYKFKHPVPNDIRRIAERISGIQLRWYITDWTQTTNTIDYAIKEVVSTNKGATVNLNRIGMMPMPLDVLIEYTDGTQEMHYIPITLMRGEKENPYDLKWNVEKSWSWANPEYSFSIEKKIEEIKSITLDPTFYMADIDRTNNRYEISNE